MTRSKTNWKIGMMLIALWVLFGNATLLYSKADILISLNIVDEDGAPIERAKVEMGYLLRFSGWKSKTFNVVGYSDLKGNYVASTAADDSVWFTVTKDGYYQSSGTYKFKEMKNGRWEPWSPEIKVVLRKIGHAVPMYARNTQFSSLIIPVVNKEIGFDLTEFDWVAPYGRGKNEDFIFKLTGSFVSQENYEMTLTLTFLRKYDGILKVEEDTSNGSQLKLPRLAAEKGYGKKLVQYRKKMQKISIDDNFQENNNYIFRVRSEEKNGKFERAIYGKIQGDIKFYPKSKETAAVQFRYYLNPDYSRNLEWSGVNLFQGLKATELIGL